jgi:hypothetical protein
MARGGAKADRDGHAMSNAALPEEITSGLEEISRATSELVEAARNEDPDAIPKAMEHREAAIRDLELHIQRFKSDAGPRLRQLLDDAGMIVEREADQARKELELLQGRMRTAMEKAVRENAAHRSYTASTSRAPAFERSA